MSDGEILINALPAAGSVTGTEVLPGMQGMATLGITTQQIADLAAALVRGGVPSNLDTLADIVAAFLPLTGGTLTGTLQLNTVLKVKAAAAAGQTRVDFLRNDNTLAARCWHYGTFNAMALDLMSTDGNSVLTRIELNGGTPGTVFINGTVVVTSANIQSYLGMLLPDYVSGMAVSYVNATTCSVAAGQALIGATAVSLASAMTKRLDGSWTAGSGNGGLDTGTVQPNATYHLRAIRNASTGVADLLWSASATAPTMPSGWNSIQRLQTVKTDGSGNIRPFVTFGKTTLLTTMIEDVSDSTLGNTAKFYTLSVPTGVSVEALMRLHVYDGDGVGFVLISSPMEDDQSPQAPSLPKRFSATTAVTNGRSGGEIRTLTNTSAQVRARAFGTALPITEVSIQTYGWVDHTIPRI